MEIKDAKELKDEIQNKAKADKFKVMVSIQQDIIEHNMKLGNDSVLWVFSDMEYYNNKLEKEWFSEFNQKAKVLFEEKGYKVKGVSICW